MKAASLPVLRISMDGVVEHGCGDLRGHGAGQVETGGGSLLLGKNLVRVGDGGLYWATG